MKNYSPKTVETYTVACRLLLRKFGDIDIKDLSYQRIAEWHEWLLGWQSKDTAKNNISAVRMVLKFLKNSGEDVINYEEIPVPRREKRKIKYLTQEEVTDFIIELGRPRRGYSKTMRERNVAIATLLYATGLRNSELCAMDRDTIKDRTFTVIGKSKAPHIAFIDEHTEIILNRYLSGRKDNNRAMFVSTKGKRITPHQLREIFDMARRHSSRFVDVHPHTLRHSYGTKLLARGVDIRYISDLMGHSDLNTTKLYTHYTNPALKEIYEKAHKMC